MSKLAVTQWYEPLSATGRREAARRAQRTELRHTGKRRAPVAGMTIAIEPMVNAGSYKVKVLPDGWTTVTTDGELSAHFEHTVAITRTARSS